MSVFGGGRGLISLEKYAYKDVKIIFTDDQVMSGYVTDWTPSDETESGLEYITVIPKEQKWLNIGHFMGIEEDEIKSIEIL